MKPFYYAFLLMLFAHSLAYGSTKCQVVEYVDRSEAICTGDEKAAVEPTAPVTPSRSATVERYAQSQVAARSIVADAAPPPNLHQQAAAPSGVASQQTTAPAANPDTAADHLARRKELATRNAGNLKNYTSASAPPGK